LKSLPTKTLFLSCNPVTPSLPSTEKELKKNEVCYCNVMLKNYKEQWPHNLKRWGAKNKLLKQITESPSMLHMFLLSSFSFNSTLTP